jgi:hypothetical protein
MLPWHQTAFMSAPSDGLHLMVPSHMSLFVTNDIWQKDIKRFEYNSFKPVVTLGKSPIGVGCYPARVP